MTPLEILATFRNGFDIQKSDMQAVQAVLKLKNDTTVFLDKDHTNNSPQFQFSLPTP